MMMIDDGDDMMMMIMMMIMMMMMMLIIMFISFIHNQDFSDRKGQESETSKVGSEEKVCLSPPWNEEDEDLLAREVC